MISRWPLPRGTRSLRGSCGPILHQSRSVTHSWGFCVSASVGLKCSFVCLLAASSPGAPWDAVAARLCRAQLGDEVTVTVRLCGSRVEPRDATLATGQVGSKWPRWLAPRPHNPEATSTFSAEVRGAWEGGTVTAPTTGRRLWFAFRRRPPPRLLSAVALAVRAPCPRRTPLRAPSAPWSGASPAETRRMHAPRAWDHRVLDAPASPLALWCTRHQAVAALGHAAGLDSPPGRATLDRGRP